MGNDLSISLRLGTSLCGCKKIVAASSIGDKDEVAFVQAGKFKVLVRIYIRWKFGNSLMGIHLCKTYPTDYAQPKSGRNAYRAEARPR